MTARVRGQLALPSPSKVTRPFFGVYNRQLLVFISTQDKQAEQKNILLDDVYFQHCYSFTILPVESLLNQWVFPLTLFPEVFYMKSSYTYKDIKSSLLLLPSMANCMDLQILPVAVYCQIHLNLFGPS